MVEFDCHLSFTPKESHHFGVEGELGADFLNRQELADAVDARIFAQINFSHATAADDFKEQIFIQLWILQNAPPPISDLSEFSGGLLSKCHGICGPNDAV
jgi:hypothetical protein